MSLKNNGGQQSNGPKQPDAQKEALERLQDKNKRFGLYVLGLVFLMVGFAYASVPLYNLFCRVTGFGGTTQRSAETAELLENRVIIDRTIRVQFNTDHAPNLPWIFKPEQRFVDVKLGQDALVSFVAQNTSNQFVTGTALYNVTPARAGKYFYKIQCFCFDKQTLAPNEEIHMPVSFFIDPEIHSDPDMEDITLITLSYSFFKTDSQALEKAKQDFYNSEQ